jgi:uncharacterized membrane protein YccC
MTLPGAFLGFLIATACGLAFHLVRGGSLSRLGLYVFTAWVSFGVGQLVSQWLDWTAWRVGSLNLIPALLATIIGLVVAAVLAGPKSVIRASESKHDQPQRPKP